MFALYILKYITNGFNKNDLPICLEKEKPASKRILVHSRMRIIMFQRNSSFCNYPLN